MNTPKTKDVSKVAAMEKRGRVAACGHKSTGNRIPRRIENAMTPALISTTDWPRKEESSSERAENHPPNIKSEAVTPRAQTGKSRDDNFSTNDSDGTVYRSNLERAVFGNAARTSVYRPSNLSVRKPIVLSQALQLLFGE